MGPLSSGWPLPARVPCQIFALSAADSDDWISQAERIWWM
jgi:hypothetical protein